MRTDEQILDRIKEVREHDHFGFGWPDLVYRLPFEKAKQFLKEDAKSEDWKAAPRDHESLLKEMKDYMTFAWTKANDCRGISAYRSLLHMESWLWLLGEDEFINKLDIQNYTHYGKPQLRAICEKYNIDWKSLDDGEWRNSETSNPSSAESVPRIELE